MLCERAKVAIDHKCSAKLRVSAVVQDRNVKVLAGSLAHLEFQDEDLILINVKDVSTG